MSITNAFRIALRKASELVYDDSVTEFGLDPADRNVQKSIELSASAALSRPATISINSLDNGILPITPEMGRYITLEDHGSDDYVIDGFGDACPVGWVITLVIPRTIGDTGGPNYDLGNYVQFIHSTSGAGLDHEMIKSMDGTTAYRGYRAYPNATDAFGNAAALHEALTYQHIGGGRWVLRETPRDAVGQNDNGSYVRSADGTQTFSDKLTVDFTNEFTTTSRMRRVWEYPASVVDTLYERAHIPVHLGTNFVGCSRTDISSWGLQGEDDDNSQELTVFFSSNSVNTSTATIFNVTVELKSRWKPLV